MPQTTKLMTQLTSAMRSGESPLTRAPTSVSADARVARPNRVKRKSDRQHDAEGDDRAGQQQAVGGDVDAEEADVVLGEDRVDQDDLRADLVGARRRSAGP